LIDAADGDAGYKSRCPECRQRLTIPPPEPTSTWEGIVDFFVVLCRFVFAIMGTIFFVLAVAVLFLLETPAAFVLFPFCAVLCNRQWFRENWPGTYPESLRWFFSNRHGPSRGGLGVIADMWTWVFHE
jgi:hypothetical protein